MSAGRRPQVGSQQVRTEPVGPLLTGLVVVVVVVLGVPAIWNSLRTGHIGLETIFYPVLGVAFGYLAVSRRGGA